MQISLVAIAGRPRQERGIHLDTLPTSELGCAHISAKAQGGFRCVLVSSGLTGNRPRPGEGVLRVHLGPKENSPMHEHPPRVVIPLTDVRLKFTLADGKTEERTATAGSVRYRAAIKHAAENLNDRDCEAIEVELKAKSAASKPAATTNSSPNPEVRVPARD